MSDYESESAFLKFYPRLPILSNYHSDYQLAQEGIYVCCHQQPAWETPEACPPFHTIGINLKRQDGRRKIQQRVFDNDIVIVPAHVTSQTNWDREIEFMMVFLPPESIAQVAYETIDPDSVELLPHFDIFDPTIYQIGLSLKAELETQGQWSHLFIDSLKTALSVNLLRRYTIHKGRILEYTDGLSKYKLRQAVDYISDHLSEDLSLLDIAKVVKMSPCYFASLFKYSTGLTVNQYVTQRRISKAKRLLKQPGLKIIEVGQAVGFESHSYFTRTFRKWTGTNPTTYREDRK
jgi:AraC family transcriptional regulator